MIRDNLLGALLCLPLAEVVFSQGASCNDSKTKANSSSTTSQTQPSSTPAEEPSRMKGQWGGQGVSMEVTGSGASLDFDCAHGSITEAIVPDGSGKFVVKGFFAREHPGPTREGEDTSGQPATYSGAIDGQTLTLAITLTGTSETMGPLTLTYRLEALFALRKDSRRSKVTVAGLCLPDVRMWLCPSVRAN